MRKQPRTTALIAIGLGLALGLAACGTSASEAPATTAPATTAPATDGAASPPVTSDSPATAAPANPDVGPLNTAVVTIGTDRHEFSNVQCSIFAPRYIQAGNFGADPEVIIVLPPEGWESQGDVFSPPSVQVKIGDEFAGGKLWLAGDNGTPTITPIAEGSSQIDSYTVPDSRPVTATGSATFIDIAAHLRGENPAPVSGTFEVSCP
jgi:hypothetical protein